MEVRLLGNVEIVGPGQTIRLKRTTERCLLAVLALNPNRALTFDNLMGKVWPADAPGSPQTLGQYARHVRRGVAMAGGDGNSLVRARGAKSLQLNIDPETVDYHRFRKLAANASRLRDPDLFDEAVSLWTAEPLADLSHDEGHWAVAQRLKMTTELIGCQQERLQLMIDTGGAGRAFAEVSELVEHYPAKEFLRLGVRALQVQDRAAEVAGWEKRVRRLIGDTAGGSAPLLTRPDEVRLRDASTPASGVAAQVLHPVPASDVRELLEASDNYARDVRIDADLHIERTVELELFDAVTNSRMASPFALVGEAGSGKTTLLCSLHRRLSNLEGVEPVLVPATSLIRAGSADMITGPFRDLSRSGRKPFLLLDTADLMLHDQAGKDLLHRLINAVHAAGHVGVYSTRPQEAAGLTHDRLWRWDLKRYDDPELSRAVTALVAHYRLEVHATEAIAKVRDATARELPAADVCRSPLLLRLLFDLSTSGLPEFNDLDVTSLYLDYWKRRVVRDARVERDTKMRPLAENNLTEVAGCTGIGLLALGLPETPEEGLVRTTASAVGRSADQAALQEALEVLTERGVLVHSGAGVGFFHQTMFEFAAAQGLLDRHSPADIGILADRTSRHGGDLFVGAVLEQVLVLCGARPLLRAAACDAVHTLLEADSQAVQAIGAVAWAHHPALLEHPVAALRKAGPAALQRAISKLPSIAGKTPADIVDQLMILWQANEEADSRTAVLQSFSRLALRAPEQVGEALHDLDLLQAIRNSDSSELRSALLDVLLATTPHTIKLLQSAALLLIEQSSDPVPDELTFFADNWSILGEPGLFKRIVDAFVGAGGDLHRAQPAFAHLNAAEWQRNGAWNENEKWKAFVQGIRADDPAKEIVSRTLHLRAIERFTIQLDDDRVSTAVDCLLDWPDDELREFVRTTVLPNILRSGSRAADVLVTAAKTSLKQLREYNGSCTRTSLLLDALAQADLPRGLLYEVLPLRVPDWNSHERLLRLAPLAADHGHPTAQRFVEQLRRNERALSDAELDTFFSTRAMHMVKTNEVFDAVIAITLASGRIEDLTTTIRSYGRDKEQVCRHTPALLQRFRTFMAGADEQQATGVQFLAELMSHIDFAMPWPELRSILDQVNDPALLAQLITSLWHQAPIGDVTEQLGWLGEFVEVRPGAKTPVARPRGSAVDTAVAGAAATAMVYLLIRSESPGAEHWPMIRTLGLHQLDEPDVHVDGRNFAIICDYLARLAVREPGVARRYLLEYLTEFGSGTFFGIDKGLWRRELRNVLLPLCVSGVTRAMRTLISTCGLLDETVAEVITEAAAEWNYAEAREPLRALSQSEQRPRLRAHLLALLRDHDRSYGTQEFPEILQSSTRTV